MKSVKIKFGLIFLSISLLPTCVFGAGRLPNSASNTKITIQIDGKIEDAPEDYGRPYFDKYTNRTMVPVRFIGEKLGAKVDYIGKNNDYKKGAFILSLEQNTITMAIGDNRAKISNGDSTKFISLDSPALVYDERSYVPIRFISETFGYKVDWKNGIVSVNRTNENKGQLKEFSNDSEKNSYKKNLDAIDGKIILREDSSSPELSRKVDLEAEKQKLFKKMNDYRVENGLAPESYSVKLGELADIRAKEILDQYLTKNTISHQRPGGIYVKDMENFAGENAIIRFKSQGDPSDTFFECWKNSQTHNKNMLAQKNIERIVGIGFAESKIEGATVYAGIQFWGFVHEDDNFELPGGNFKLSWN